MAEWSGTQLRLRCWEGPGFKPRARDLGTAPARVQGEQPEVDRDKFPLEFVAAGVFVLVSDFGDIPEIYSDFDIFGDLTATISSCKCSDFFIFVMLTFLVI